MNERFVTFSLLLNKINRNIRKMKNLEMAEYGLRSTHVTCLYHLYSAEALTATELCERCEEDKATISRALDFLEEQGFVVCECKTAKRYKSPMCLTEKGKEAGKKIFDKVNCVVDEVSVGLTEEQRKTFYCYLSIISDQLDKAAADYCTTGGSI
ncbi:MAG: winged helix-turn-helix transcriptional regulator [Oscillospiraceae bacterium]|nr:winged helix-turn-helix transcriptional regulator [Oscillospiraceae bacterium]